MTNGRERFLRTALICISALSSASWLYGQGCIIARSNGEAGGPAAEGGYLSDGEWDFGISYRHQFSFRHFVGPTEQTYRIQQGTEVMNKINLMNFNVTYQATPRFGITADIPVLLASRRSNNSAYTSTTQGIGDASFLATGWIWDPRENTRGNIQFGFGVSLPTGKDNAANVVDKFDGKGPQTVIADYSIQPGTGGYGLIFSWNAYKNIPGSQLYFSGNYLATPQNYNHVLRSATASSQPLTAYNSISDEYLLEAGVAHPIRKIHGLTALFGPRMEGVPARDLIGDSLGFRRPGFAISLEPGFEYYHNGNIVTVQIARAIYRDRTKSVPDVLLGTHGDAAFADWVWLASWQFRYKPDRHTHMPDHDTALQPHQNATQQTASKVN